MQLGLRQRLESCKTLPSLPPVALHVLRLCQRENFDITDVARAIGTDATLGGRVVGLVNSPLFSLRQEVRTVSQALVLLGVNAVRTIALAFSVLDELRAHERNGSDHQRHWRRAVTSAVAAQLLARLEGVRHPAEAFLAALLQDIGVLALEEAVREQYLPLQAQAGDDHEALIALEKETFGCDHAEVGRWLTTRWRLPDPVRAAIGSSHEPTRWQLGSDAATETMVKVVALSGVLGDVWAMADTARAARRARAGAKEIMGLDEDRVKSLLTGIAKASADIAPLFDIPCGTVEELVAVAGQAADAMVERRAGGGAGDGTGQQEGGAGATTDPTLTDGLTGLASRARFDMYLAEQFEVAQNEGKPLSLLICDLDHFQIVNQTFGRDAGDRALAAVGRLLGDRLRSRDLAARWAGEEFALLLTDTHAAGARAVAERLRRRVEETPHDIGVGDPVRLTISVGCVTLDEALAFGVPADLLLAAEQTVGQAKRAGRNRVMTFSTVPAAA